MKKGCRNMGGWRYPTKKLPSNGFRCILLQFCPSPSPHLCWWGGKSIWLTMPKSQHSWVQPPPMPPNKLTIGPLSRFFVIIFPFVLLTCSLFYERQYFIMLYCMTIPHLWLWNRRALWLLIFWCFTSDLVRLLAPILLYSQLVLLL